MKRIPEIISVMEHYFDAAKVFVLAESSKNETVESETDKTGLIRHMEESTWLIQRRLTHEGSSNEDSYDHERYMHLTMLFLVLFFLVRKLSKIMTSFAGCNGLFVIISKYFHGG